MTDIEWVPQDTLDHYRELLDKWIGEGDRTAVVELRRDLVALISAARLLVGDAETAIQGWAAEPFVVDGQRFRVADDARTEWDARGLLGEVVRWAGVEEAGPVVSALMAVLPSVPSFRVGKPGADGVRSLGLNPDDWSERVVKGRKLVVEDQK